MEVLSMEVVSIFPNISIQQVNQRPERWINVQNSAQAISKQQRDDMSDLASTHVCDHVALGCIDLVSRCTLLNIVLLMGVL